MLFIVEKYFQILCLKRPQPDDSILKYKRTLNYGFGKVGGTMGLNTFDVCTPVIFHEPLSNQDPHFLC
jgi:hypothetical protein